jgi:hypothetical protein
MIHQINKIGYHKDKVLDYLSKNNFDKVLDVGGALGPWAGDYVTHYCDIQDVHSRESDAHNLKKVKGSVSIVGDLEDFKIQEQLLKEAPFDFVICSHCLEHLGKPHLILDFLPKIGKEGFICLPNGVIELMKGIYYKEMQQKELEQLTRGFIPHRWVFDTDTHTLFLFPKFSVLDSMSLKVDNISDLGGYADGELSFWWKDSIPFVHYDDSFFDYPDMSDSLQFLKSLCDKVYENLL